MTPYYIEVKSIYKEWKVFLTALSDEKTSAEIKTKGKTYFQGAILSSLEHGQCPAKNLRAASAKLNDLNAICGEEDSIRASNSTIFLVDGVEDEDGEESCGGQALSDGRRIFFDSRKRQRSQREVLALDGDHIDLDEILELKQEHELKMMAMKHQFQLAKIEEMKLQLQIAKLSSPTKNIMSASDAHDDDSFTF